MINLLLCGNRRVFDGALTQLISMTNRTKEPIHVFLMTMNLERVREDFLPITEEQAAFLNRVIQEKNPENRVEIPCSDCWRTKSRKSRTGFCIWILIL